MECWILTRVCLCDIMRSSTVLETPFTEPVQKPRILKYFYHYLSLAYLHNFDVLELTFRDLTFLMAHAHIVHVSLTIADVNNKNSRHWLLFYIFKQTVHKTLMAWGHQGRYTFFANFLLIWIYPLSMGGAVCQVRQENVRTIKDDR